MNSLTGMRTFRIAMRIADLQQTLEKIHEKYPKFPRQILEYVSNEIPESALEWVVNSISNNSGRWPEDVPRFLEAWQAFTTMQGNQAFKQALAQINPNTRNPLNFTLHQIEAAEAAAKPPEKSKRQEIRDIKMKGVKLLNEKDGIRVYEVTTPEAACYMSKETKWCTSNPTTADTYLINGPLYIFVDSSGQKLAQCHPESGELKDAPDVDILGNKQEPYLRLLPPKAREVFLYEADIKDLQNEVLNFDDHAGSSSEEETEMNLRDLQEKVLDKGDPQLCAYFAAFAANSPFPEGESIIAQNARASLYYAESSLYGPFPEGEPAIAKSPQVAADYMKKFPARREAIHQLAIPRDR